MTVEVGGRLELTIERLVAGGDGLARSDDGRVIFVSRAAPGDRALCEIHEVRRGYARARIVELISPGPGRRSPPCPYADRCGGCGWMHLDDATQSAARQAILTDALRRIGGLEQPPEIETLPSPRTLGYRSRARIAYRTDSLGFRAARSHDVVDVEICLVLDDATQGELAALRRSGPRRRRSAGEVEIRGFGSRAGPLRVSAGAFVQPNGALWSAWPALVAEACGEGELAVELYAGVGFYTVALEKRFKSVIAVERGRAAGDLRHNTSARVFRMSAETFASTRLAALRPDVVLLNPPRAGCDAAVVKALCDQPPPRVVYVSCDAATLARDVARLRTDFDVKRIVSIDALPQTPHIEALLFLTAKAASP